MLPGSDAREGRQELHQGAEQGRAEGDVQDGHLDAAELSRRADFRSRRPRKGVRRSATSRTPRRASAASASTPSPKKCARATRWRSRSVRWRIAISTRAASTSGGATESSISSTPTRCYKLQHATRTGQYQVYKEYTQAVNEQTRKRATLRGLFELKLAATPIPIEEVEPVESILKRFATGAMSYGSISQEAHETLAIAMNRLGGKSNTGEGGEDPARYVPDAERRFAAERDQAGRIRALRRDERVSRQRRRSADQDGAGREARRGRTAARAQGVPVDCEGASRDAGRRA